MIEQIQNWDRNSQPPKASEVVEHDEFKALPPAGKIDTLNKLQAQWADVYSVEAPKEEYAGALRDMETWFGDQRKAIVKKGLAEDMAAGKLTDKQVQAYMTQGPDALDDAEKQHFAQKYGDPRMVAGPWVTTKVPIVGADGKPVGFQYIRRRPSLNGQAIAENMGIPGDQWNQAGYLMHNAGTQEPLTWKNPDSADNIEVSWTVNGNDGKQYHGVEQVSGGEQFARLADAQRSMAYYQGMTDPGMSGPSRETADLANLPDVAGSEGLPAALAADAVSRRLQGDPEIAKKIGQGLLAGLPGEALKGFMNLGASALYGPQALFGSKQAARDYQAAIKDVDATIEGQSRAGFEGGMLNNALKAASGEAIPMLFSMGTGLIAGGVRKLAQGATESAAKSFMESAATTSLKQAPTLLKSLSGGFGRIIGTAELKSEAAKIVSDRVLNALAFLPSSMRSGLDNMATTLDTAEDLRKQGKTKEADAVEDNAVWGMLAGTAIETLSENLWVNEMMVTKAGRPISAAITSALNRKLGNKMGKVADFFTKTLTAANQEGIEEIVAGVGNAAWMNAYAAQHKDIFGDIPSDYLGGAIMGGLMQGAKSLKGEKAQAFAAATTQTLQQDQQTAADLADIRAQAEELASNPQPEQVAPEPPAESISSAPPPASDAGATLQTSPEATVPVEPAGPEVSPGLSAASGAESAAEESRRVMAAAGNAAAAQGIPDIMALPRMESPEIPGLMAVRHDPVTLGGRVNFVFEGRGAAEAFMRNLSFVTNELSYGVNDANGVSVVNVKDMGGGTAKTMQTLSLSAAAARPTSPAPVETPRAFAPVAPLPESKTADEVAKSLHDARSEAIDAANESIDVPGAEVTAEALASIAADEGLPDATEPPDPVAIADSLADEIRNEISGGSGRQSPDVMRAKAALGKAIDPDLRLSDHYALADVYLMYRNGDISADEFTKYHDDARAQYESLRGTSPVFKVGRGAVDAPPGVGVEGDNEGNAAKSGSTRPKLRFTGPKQAGASLGGQTEAAYNGGRIATLRLLNERVNAYPGETFDGIDPSQVDEVLDYMVSIQKPTTPEPISPDGNVATPSTETPALPLAETAQEPAIAPAADAADSGKATVEEPTTETGRQVKEAFAGMASAATEGARRRVTELLDKGTYILENKAAGDAALANPDYRAERLPDGRVQITDVVNPDTGTWHREAKAPATKPEQMSPEVERLKYLKSREVNAAGGTSLSDAEDAELAEMTGQFAPRDATKPEQMTPEEALQDAKDRNAKAFRENSPLRNRFEDEGSIRGAMERHKSVVMDAMRAFGAVEPLETPLPVSAAAVDAYKITLPAGYERQGELYVFVGGNGRGSDANRSLMRNPQVGDTTAPDNAPASNVKPLEQMPPDEILAQYGENKEAASSDARKAVEKAIAENRPVNTATLNRLFNPISDLRRGMSSRWVKNEETGMTELGPDFEKTSYGSKSAWRQSPDEYLNDNYPLGGWNFQFKGTRGKTKTSARNDHAEILRTAVKEGSAVNAEAVKLYKVAMPAGYERQGELYVFTGNQSAAETPASNENPSQATESSPGTFSEKTPDETTPEGYKITKENTRWVVEGNGAAAFIYRSGDGFAAGTTGTAASSPNMKWENAIGWADNYLNQFAPKRQKTPRKPAPAEAPEAKAEPVDTSNPAGLTYEQLAQFRKDEAVKAAEEALRRAKSGEDAPNAFTNGFKSKAAMVRAREEELNAAQSVKPDVWQTAMDASYAKKPVSTALIDTLSSTETKLSDGNIAPSMRRQLIENLEEKGYVREGDQYVYRPKESAGPDIVEGMLITESAVNTPDGTKKRWMVQTDENKQRVANGERELGGNGLYSSREEAVAAIKQQREMERKNAEYQQAAEEKRQKEAAAFAEKQAPLVAFLDSSGLNPMAQGKLKSALEQSTAKRSSASGKTYSGTRFSVIGQMVDDGYSVATAEVDKIKDLTGRQSNRLTNEEQSAFERRKAQSGLKTEYLIKNDAGEFIITKAEYDYGKWYQKQKSAAPEKVGSGAVATASPEPVPSGAPAKNLPKTDTKPANVNSPAPQLVEREFTPGEILEMRSPYTGDVVSVNYRGPLGDKSVVVMEKGGQTSVPTAWLARSREAQLEILRKEFDDVMQKFEDAKPLVEKGKPLPPEYFAAERESAAILKKIQELEKPIKEAEAKAKSEKDAADSKDRSAKRDERVASLPVFQKRNGWEIVKDFEQRYILRDPNSKEEVYAGTLSRVREVADESPPTPAVVKSENGYAYAMKARPFDIGAQPKGFSRVDENDKRGRWGVIYYPEPLTADQIQKYELVELEGVVPDPNRPSGNDFPSADIEPALTTTTPAKSTAKKESQVTVIPRKTDGTPVDPIRPAWDDKSRMDAEQYGYVTDGKKLYIIDRQKSLPMQEAKPATTYSDAVPGKWDLYVREYAEDGTQGKSKRMPIPENTLYPVKSSKKWYQRKAEMERQSEEPRPIEPDQTDAPETEYFPKTGITTDYGPEYAGLEQQLDDMPKVKGKSMLEHVRRLTAKGETWEKFPKVKKIVDRMKAIEQEANEGFTWTPEDDPADRGGAEIAGATGGALLHPLTAPAAPIVPLKGQSEIIRDLARALKLPIRFGRLTTPKFAGYFKRVQDLIGVKRANDLPSVAHEVGHKIDSLFDISSNPAIAAELDTLGDPSTPNSKSSWTPSKTNAYKMGEGVGEFVRYWLTEPATASRMAPATEAYWNTILDANPDFADQMRQAQSDIHLWRTAPAEARLDSSISTGSNPNKTHYRLNQLTRDLVDDLHILRVAFDDYEKLNGKVKPSENFYMLARLMRGSFGMAGTFVQKGTANFTTKNVTLGNSLEDALKPVAGRLNEFRRWIIAKRAQELRKRGKETGLVPADVDEIATKYDGDAVFEKAFEDVKAWQDSVLQYCVDSGYVTAEAADNMREMNRDYVPFHRVFEIGAGENSSQEGSGIGRGLNVGRAGSLKRLDGSLRDIVDPIETMIKNAYTLITAAEKSNVSAQISKLASKQGMGKWVEEVATPKEPVRVQVESIKKQLEDAGADVSAVPDDLALTFFQHSGRVPFGENIIKVTTNGQTKFYRLNSDLFDTFHSLNNENSSALTKLLAAPAQILRSGVTLDPAFTGANIFKDAFGSSIISKYGLFPFQAAYRGIVALLKDKKSVAEWAASGGEQSFEAIYFDQVKLADYIRQNIAKDKSKAVRTTAWIHPKNWLLAMRYVSGMGEMVTRIGEYKTAYEHAVKNGMAEGDARRQAAFESRDRQDFSVGGAKTRGLRQTAPFWNVGIQGNLAILRAFKARPLRSTLQGLAFITLPTIALMAINHDDEDYWDRPQWERDLCWLIPYGKDANGRTKFMRMPKPFILGQIFGTTFERAGAHLKGRENPYKDFTSSIYSNVVPVPIPTFLAPLEALIGDRGFVFWKGEYLIPKKLEDVPPEFQVTEQTSLMARKLGKLFELSPMKIDHMISSVTGGVGKQVVHGGIDNIISAISGDKPTAQNVGVFSRFFAVPAGINSANVNDFYERITELREAKRREDLGGRPMNPGDRGKLNSMELAAKQISHARDRAHKTPDMVARQKIYLEIVRKAKQARAQD